MSKAIDVLDFKDQLGDGAQFVIHADGTVYVQCYCEWCGSTETGFGAEVGATLSPEQATTLYLRLQAMQQPPQDRR